MRNFIYVLLILFCVSFSITTSGENGKGEKKEKQPFCLNLIEDNGIYFNNTHAAFTSLEEWNDELYLAFREARHHKVTPDDKGKIRIMKNTSNGWITNHILEIKGEDLRDPFFLNWDKHLFLYTSGYYSKLTTSGWTKLKKIHHNAPYNLWIWKIRQYKNKLYGIGYTKGKWPILLTSTNGSDWEVLNTFKIGGNASEADMVFINDSIYICLRIDTPVGSNSMWGSGEYPFNQILWTQMSASIASPELIYLSKNNQLLLAGREYIFLGGNSLDSISVSIFSINRDGSLQNRYTLNTGKKGDKGYPSFCYFNNKLYMSYYMEMKTHTLVKVSMFEIK